MQITNSNLQDVPKIFDLYRIATAYMKSKNQVCWPEFPRDMIEEEVENKRQWKMILEGEIACIWATALNDELIWGEQDQAPSLYLHRIAASPDFRGRNLVSNIVAWAEAHCIEEGLKFIRMDTVGFNQGLITHYQRLGFEFLGIRGLENTEGLPEHYKDGKVCFFQRAVS